MGRSDSFRSVGKTVANDGLKAAEAPLLKSLGLGKADGSRSNPFFVRLADALGFGKGSLGGTATAAAGGAVNLAKGAQDVMQGAAALFKNAPGDADDASDDGGNASGSDAGSTTATATQASGASKAAAGIIGGIGKLVGAFGGLFGGGKALGGGVQAGVEYDVGEMGREKFIPATDGVIVPNHVLGGDSATYQISVGHGVTPTEFEMKLQQALQTYHKRVMPAGAVAAVQNHNQRSTSSARR